MTVAEALPPAIDDELDENDGFQWIARFDLQFPTDPQVEEFDGEGVAEPTYFIEVVGWAEEPRITAELFVYSANDYCCPGCSASVLGGYEFAGNSMAEFWGAVEAARAAYPDAPPAPWTKKEEE